MIRRLLCKLGFHWWNELQPRSGWRLYECGRCGRVTWVADS